jgi:hypothetical protein
VGLAVTFRWTSWRRSWATKTRTYSVLNVSVRTVSRSAAQMLGRPLRRKVRQVWLGGRAGPRRRDRWTLASLTAMPSFSNSPRIRSAPQVGFSRAIRAIRSRTAARSRGRRRVGRVRTASWWRGRRFSATRSTRARTMARRAVARSRSPARLLDPHSGLNGRSLQTVKKRAEAGHFPLTRSSHL